MITVYELERKVPNYYGLCGLKTERAFYVRSHLAGYLIYDNYHLDLMRLSDSGWKVVKERDFPARLITGGFTRRIN